MTKWENHACHPKRSLDCRSRDTFSSFAFSSWLFDIRRFSVGFYEIGEGYRQGIATLPHDLSAVHLYHGP